MPIKFATCEENMIRSMKDNAAKAKFQLEYMALMLMSGRQQEIAEPYEKAHEHLKAIIERELPTAGQKWKERR